MVSWLTKCGLYNLSLEICLTTMACPYEAYGRYEACLHLRHSAPKTTLSDLLGNRVDLRRPRDFYGVTAFVRLVISLRQLIFYGFLKEKEAAEHNNIIYYKQWRIDNRGLYVQSGPDNHNN